MQCIYPLISWIPAKLWAGKNGVVVSHGWSSIGVYCDVVFAHGCWRGVAALWGVEHTFYSRLVSFYEALAGSLAKHVVAVSSHVQKEWIKLYNIHESKTSVLHNACNMEVFQAMRGAGCADQHRKFTVLFVGRLEKWKGKEFVKQLCREVRESDTPSIKVVICTPQILSVRDTANFTGAEFVASLSPAGLSALYNSADVLLLPSLYESFEMVTIEALCCGTPVMLNDTGTRPFLLSIKCPGVYCLDSNCSPLEHVLKARDRFAQLNRDELSQWAHRMFDPEKAKEKLIKMIQAG